MSTATLNRAACGTAERRAVQPVTFMRVLRSEWVKAQPPVNQDHPGGGGRAHGQDRADGGFSCP